MAGNPALAQIAAAILAVDAPALGGLCLHGAAGPLRDAWLAALRALLPPATPWCRLPVSIGEDRLVGGVDLAASLAARRAVWQPGLLAQCDGGVLEVPMAERLPSSTAAVLAAVLDSQAVRVERDGFTEHRPARLAVLALDEALSDDAPMSAALADRLALHVWIEPAAAGPAASDDASLSAVVGPAALAAARARWRSVAVPDAMLRTLCEATLALGIGSARAPWQAVQVARLHAALRARGEVDEDDLRVAMALVLAPRATRVPSGAPSDDAAENEPVGDAAAEKVEAARGDAPSQAEPGDAGPAAAAHGEATTEPGADRAPPTAGALPGDRLVAAALSALPAGLLAQLAQQARRAAGAAALRRGASNEGRAGALAASRRRGAPTGTRRGDPRRGERLSVVETLRAALPWQRLRGACLPEAAAPAASSATAPGPLRLRMDDLRVVRRAQHRRSTTVFVIDASGSSALHRLAEAKGAVEQLLAESYVRRDEVAVIAFRGRSAELLLPPTRSLVRARRALAGLPGGGGTPLAAALDAAASLVMQVLRRGATPSVVLLTDGRANVALDAARHPAPDASPGGAGGPDRGDRPACGAAAAQGAAGGRARAEADALAAARRLALCGARSLLVDTSPRPAEAAARLAAAMQARYLPLPHLRGEAVAAAVRGLAP